MLRQLIPASERLGFAIVRGVDDGLDFEAAIENLRAALGIRRRRRSACRRHPEGVRAEAEARRGPDAAARGERRHDRPSGSVYGNPLGGTRDDAPVVPIGAPLIARTDVPDARGWRVYRVAPAGAVICRWWIEHDPAHAEPALTELRAAAHDAPQREPRRPAVDPDRCPWSATGAALQRAGPPDDDHAGRRAAWCGADTRRTTPTPRPS